MVSIDCPPALLAILRQFYATGMGAKVQLLDLERIGLLTREEYNNAILELTDFLEGVSKAGDAAEKYLDLVEEHAT